MSQNTSRIQPIFTFLMNKNTHTSPARDTLSVSPSIRYMVALRWWVCVNAWLIRLVTLYPQTSQ